MVDSTSPAHDRNGLPLSFGLEGVAAPVPPPVEKRAPRNVFAVQAHAAQRAAERWGLALTWDDLRAIALICKRGSGCSGRQVGGREFHTVIFADRVLNVVYRRHAPPERDGVVLTILPKDARENVYRAGLRERAARLQRVALYKGRQR